MSTEVSIDSYFTDKSTTVREIYDRLLTRLGEIGPVMEEAKPTAIHLVNTSALAGVAARKNFLLLNIKSNRKLENPRIFKSETFSGSRFHHQIKLTQVADIDDELMDWLRTAYALSA